MQKNTSIFLLAKPNRDSLPPNLSLKKNLAKDPEVHREVDAQCVDDKTGGNLIRYPISFYQLQ